MKNSIKLTIAGLLTTVALNAFAILPAVPFMWAVGASLTLHGGLIAGLIYGSIEKEVETPEGKKVVWIQLDKEIQPPTDPNIEETLPAIEYIDATGAGVMSGSIVWNEMVGKEIELSKLKEEIAKTLGNYFGNQQNPAVAESAGRCLGAKGVECYNILRTTASGIGKAGYNWWEVSKIETRLIDTTVNGVPAKALQTRYVTSSWENVVLKVSKVTGCIDGYDLNGTLCELTQDVPQPLKDGKCPYTQDEQGNWRWNPFDVDCKAVENKVTVQPGAGENKGRIVIEDGSGKISTVQKKPDGGTELKQQEPLPTGGKGIETAKLDETNKYSEPGYWQPAPGKPTIPAPPTATSNGEGTAEHDNDKNGCIDSDNNCDGVIDKDTDNNGCPDVDNDCNGNYDDNTKVPGGSGEIPPGYTMPVPGTGAVQCGGSGMPACKVDIGLDAGGDPSGTSAVGEFDNAITEGESEEPTLEEVEYCEDCEANKNKKESFWETLMEFDGFIPELQASSCTETFSSFNTSIELGGTSADLSISPVCELMDNGIADMLRALFTLAWTLYAIVLVLEKSN